MWRWTDLPAAAIPLVVLPWLLGAALLGPSIAGPVRWWVAMVASGLFFAAAHALGASFPHTSVSYLLVAGGILLVGWGRIASAVKALAGPRRRADRVATSIWVFLVLAIGAFVLSRPVTAWDAAVIWFAKARALYEGLAFGELPFPNYPDLGPTLWMLVMRCVGTRAEEVGRLVFPLLYFGWGMSLSGLWSGARRRVAAWVALAVCLAGLGRPVFNGYQDAFLMACAGMAALHFARMTLEGTDRRSDRLLAFFFAGSAIFVKNEGAVLALILLVAWFAAVTLHGGLRAGKAALGRVWPMLLLALGLLAAWPSLLALNGIPPAAVQGNAFTPSSLLGSAGQLDRLGMILPYVGVYFRDHAGLLLASVLVTVVAWRWDARTRPAATFLWIVWILHGAFVVVVFLATRQDLAWHLATAFHRLASQHAFVVALLLCLGFPVLWERALPRTGGWRRRSRATRPAA